MTINASSTNYIMANNGNVIRGGLVVTVDILQDINGPDGFSLQLNCYSEAKHADSWQQYWVRVDPLGDLYAEIEIWQNPPIQGSGGIVNKEIPLAASQGGVLPAGYRLSISLVMDQEVHNVIAVQYILYDGTGKTVGDVTRSLTAIYQQVDLAPIVGFEFNIVGQHNGQFNWLKSGRGTITYTVGSDTLTPGPAIPPNADLTGTGWGTAEGANSNYGPLPLDPANTFTQTFNTLPWLDNQLPATVTPYPGTPLSGYTDGSGQHVHYIGSDSQVHELFLANGSAKWQDNTLSQMAGGPPADPGSGLHSYTSPSSGQHVNYVSNSAGTEGHIQELFTQAGTGWSNNDLSKLAQAEKVTALPGTSLSGYTDDSGQHVHYIGTDRGAHELFLANGAKNWVHNPLTQETGAPPARVLADGTLDSGLDAYTSANSGQHVVYVSDNNHIQELFTQAGIKWTNNDLTHLYETANPQSPKVGARSSTKLSGYADGSGLHVHYIGTDNGIHELFLSAGSKSWQDNPLTYMADGPAVRSPSGLHSYIGGDGSQHVNYISEDGDIQELYLASGTQYWNTYDLTQLAGNTGVQGGRGTALDGYVGDGDQQHVNFIDVNGNLNELYTQDFLLSDAIIPQQTSPAGPALAAALDGNLYLAWTGVGNNQLNIAVSSDNGTTFPRLYTSPQTSQDGPSLCALNGNLYLAWTGVGNNQLNIAQVGLDGARNPVSLAKPLTLPETSPAGPALTSLNGKLYLAWTGVGNNQLNIASLNDNLTTFSGPYPSPQTSQDGPSLCALNGNLYLAWTGVGNNQLNIAQVGLDGARNPVSLAKPLTLPETSPAGPALTSLNGNFYLAWTGVGNNQLNIAGTSDNLTTFPRTYISPQTSQDAPSLCTLNGNLYLAWTAVGNNQLSIAQPAAQL